MSDFYAVDGDGDEYGDGVEEEKDAAERGVEVADYRDDDDARDSSKGRASAAGD